MKLLLSTVLVLFPLTALAAEMPSLSNYPIQSPASAGSSNTNSDGSSYAPGSDSFNRAMQDSKSQPEPVYVPVPRQEQRNGLETDGGSLKRGW